MKTLQIFIITLLCIISIGKTGGKGGHGGGGRGGGHGGSSRGGSNNRDKQGGWSTTYTPDSQDSNTNNGGSGYLPSGWSNSNSNTQSPDSAYTTNTDMDTNDNDNANDYDTDTNTDNDYNSGGWSNSNRGNRGNKGSKGEKGDDEDIGGGRKDKDDCWGKKRRRKRRKKKGNGKRWKGKHCDDDSQEIWMSSTYDPIWDTDVTDDDDDDDTTTTTEEMTTTTATTTEDTSSTAGCVPSPLCPCQPTFAQVCCSDGVTYDNQCSADCQCQFECVEGACLDTTAAKTVVTGNAAPTVNTIEVECPPVTDFDVASTPCECWKDQQWEACPTRCIKNDDDRTCVTRDALAKVVDEEKSDGFLSGTSNGRTAGLIGGLIGLIILISCCLIIAVVIYCKRRNKKQYDNVAAMDDVEGVAIEDGRADVTKISTARLDGEDSEIGHETGKTQAIAKYDSSDDEEEEDISDDNMVLPQNEGNDNYTPN